MRPSIDRPNHAGQSSAAPTRPDADPVGYGFDPIPSAIRSDRRLRPIDHQVLAILISFAYWRRDSCWTTMETVARRLPALRRGRSGSPVACARTAKRSVARLKEAGYIRHERVAKPDPDQPDNETGWRFYFNFRPVPPPAAESPREVTKGGGEVTKGPIGVTGGPGEGPNKSRDSLVTQVRGEVREPESTFNVAALAGEGDGGTATADDDPGADGEVVAAAAASPPAVVWSDAELAEKLVRMVRAGGVDLRVEAHPERGEVIQPVKLSESARELSPGAIDALKRLRPHVLAFLKGVPAAVAPAAGPAAPPPAPRVREPARARSLLARLAVDPDDADAPLAAVRALAEALGDHKPESRATFHGLARDVQAGRLAVGCLLDAFDEASKGGKRNRGAAFVDAVKRWKREGVRGRSPARGERLEGRAP